jgi:hypothetical protein
MNVQGLLEFLHYPELLLTLCKTKGEKGYPIYQKIWDAALQIDTVS